MKYILFALLAAVSVGFLIPGIFQIYIGLLCRKEENLHWVPGKRVHANTARNVYEPGTWQRKKLDHYTNFIYEYTVAGKTYTLRGGAGVAPGKLPKSPRVIYLKKHPCFAKIQGVWDFHALFMGGFLVFGGVLFGFCSLLALFV